MTLPRFDHNGVLLDYADPAVLRPHHVERKPQPADLERVRLIEGERELLKLYVIWECSGYPEFALNRIEYSLEAVRMALQVKRRQYDMSTAESEAAA